MSERYEMLGQREGLKEKFKRLEVECIALRDKQRRGLPLHVDVIDLDADENQTLAIALRTSHDELKAVQRQIDILNRQLGE